MPILYESLFVEACKCGNVDSKSRRMFEFMKRFTPDRYQDALAEAKRIGEATGIPMIVEGLKPSHFGWTEFVLPVGVHSMTLKDNVRFYPVGIFSTDQDFTTLKWWRGARIGYIADWPVFYVPQTKEKQARMTPQPVFKTSFTFEVVSSDPGRIRVHAWILGYVVLPETMREMKVTR